MKRNEPTFGQAARIALFLGLAAASVFAQDAPGATKARRTPWTNSRIHGSPEPPPPYRIELAFPKLKFTRPVDVVSAPGTERLFVAELDGKIYSFPNDPTCKSPDLVFDLPKSVEGGRVIYGLAFHPKFAENRYAYLCYVLKDGDPEGTRVSRFEVTRNDPPRFRPETEKILITWFSGGHNGGCLKFGPDGYLYISTGDGTAPSPPDGLDTGQDCSDLLSSILRIDVDNPAPGKTYRIPPDNPFVGLENVRPEIWAFGLRNPWKMSFDRTGGDLWVGDVGWELWEMVYHIQRGGNYGWSVMEGPQPVRPESRRGPTPILPPVVYHSHSEAASVTGGYVYHGKRLPDLVGAYIYGDYVSGKIWALRYDGKKVTWHEEIARTPIQVIGFCEDNAGELYVMDYERTGQIYSIVPNPADAANEAFPQKLSETGLFASVEDLTPAPGVIPYRVNAPLWSDHATAERLLALPGTSQIEFQPKEPWKFPEGTVLARTVSLEMEAGNSASSRRLETQLLHFEGDQWHYYTYIWNDAQTDAQLADAEGSTRTLTVADASAPGGKREQEWRFAARTECARCHNPWAGYVLGADLAQLNTQKGTHGASGQLAALVDAGVFSNRLPASPPKLANPYDTSADINDRARAYFHVNCAHCHRNGGGGTATIELMHSLGLDKTGTIAQRPTQGTFGLAGAEIIAPGDPFASVLYYRMAKLGRGRMPRVGSECVDEKAVELVYDWIAQLPKQLAATGNGGHGAKSNSGTGGTSGTGVPPVQAADSQFLQTLLAKDAVPAERSQAIAQLIGSTRGALELARLMGGGQLARDVRRQVLAQVKTSPAMEIRDLFERFLPAAERTKRLGTVIKPDEILALHGDAVRGREVFFNDSAAQCKTCHRVGDVGGKVGPELTEIAKKYPRPELLAQILEPSKKIDPQFVTYLLETKSGKVHTGLLAEKTAEKVVLRDAQDKLIEVPAGEVALLAPQQLSLMPELLLRDLTAQQVADLLEYLTSLK